MPLRESRSARRTLEIGCAALLFLINAFVCRELFHAEYIDAFSSVEGSFIALSRWILESPRDISWLPYWFGGMPWIDVYQPGFHAAVALIAATFRVSPALAYHALNAFAYCLGPVTFFWMCRSLAGSRAYAFLTALFYSTFSISVAFPLVMKDLGGAFRSRRIQEITNYGEGPHLAVLVLLPLVVLLLDRACRGRSRLALSGASLALAACMLANWPGTVGVGMALLAYTVVYAKTPYAWACAAFTATLAYGLSWPWIPPSTLKRVFLAAQQANGNYPLGWAHVVFLCVFLAAILLLAWLFRRARMDEFLQFSLFLALLPAVVFCAWTNWGFALLPQPFRWHLEFELGATAAVVFAAWRASAKRAWLRNAIAGALILFCSVQVFVYRDYAGVKIQPISVQGRLEYRAAKWLDKNLHGQRVFVPGSVSLWLNAFADNPQFAGCCDQGVTNTQFRSALHTIYTGENAGARDGENSVLWLKTFGVQAVEIGGPGSAEIFHPFRNPDKFDHLLPLLWKEGSDAIYAIPQRSASLAHGMYRSSLVTRAPVNGLDEAPLLPYVKALDDPSLPLADFQWTSRHSAWVRANLLDGQVISIQESYDASWRATANGAPASVSADALGLMVVNTHCTGMCVIEMQYSAPRSMTVAWIVAAAGAILLLAIAVSAC